MLYRHDSFDSLKEWKQEIENNTDRDVLQYLVGNRADLEDQREVATEDALNLAKEMGLDHHIETSALTGDNVGKLFETITKHLYMENNTKLGEFRDDGASYNENRSSSISFGQNKRNLDLYQPNKKKKKGCAC